MASARELMDQLETGLDHLLDSDNFRHWLTVEARFHQYSFGNVLLIASQRPDATQVAGFHAWKKLGRSVKKGEHGIMILAPMTYKTTGPEAGPDGEPEEQTYVRFRVVYVFDIRQTDGAPLPSLAMQGLQGTDAASAPLRDELLNLAAAEGLTVNLRATDCAAAKGFYGYYQRAAHTIHVAADCSPNQVAETLAHELGHHLLGHGSHSDERRTTIEVQAESFGYIVCAAAGLLTKSLALPYIASWAAGDTPEAKRHAIRAALTPVHDAVAACLKRLPIDPTTLGEEAA